MDGYIYVKGMDFFHFPALPSITRSHSLLIHMSFSFHHHILIGRQMMNKTLHLLFPLLINDCDEEQIIMNEGKG